MAEKQEIWGVKEWMGRFCAPTVNVLPRARMKNMSFHLNPKTPKLPPVSCLLQGKLGKVWVMLSG